MTLETQTEEHWVPQGFDTWQDFKTEVRLFFETASGKRAIAGAERGVGVVQRLYEEHNFKDGVKQAEDAGEQHKGPQMA